MKINDKIATIEGNAVFSETTTMSFDASSTAFIIRSLTNMYSDPYSAIVREYTSNAYDSHILAGQTIPVEVTTPSRLNANLTIRDFGIGMSRKELNEIYSKYGASTKRDTDDLIGGFGLGAKSALALVAQFTVVSVKDNKKNTVIISKDATGVGELNFLDEADTDDANGVTVTIPIPDSNRLNDVIASKDIFLGWPHGAVSVNGRPVVNTVHNAETYTPLDSIGWVKVVTEPTRYWYSHGDKAFTALIGPVSYKISTESLGADYSAELAAFFNNKLKDVVINVPNGSVDLTPSREELVYSVRTRAAIIASLTKMAEAVTKNFQSRIAAVGDVDEAFKLAIALRKQGFSTVDLSWHGIEIPTVINFAKDLSADLVITRTDVTNGRTSHKRLVRDFSKGGTLTYAPFATWNDHYADFSYNGGVSDQNDIVVVIGANAPAIDTNKHALVSNLSAYFKAQDAKPRTVYTVSGDISVLDRWFLSMTTKVIQASEVLDFARAARKSNEEAAKGRKVATTKTSVSIPVATRVNNYSDNAASFKSTIINSDELPEGSKFVIIPKTTEAGPFMSLKNKVYDVLRNENNLPKTHTSMVMVSGAVALLMENGYTVVSLPENRNVERVITALGNVFDFDTIFLALVEESLNSLTVSDKEWMTTLLKGGDLKWTRNCSAEDIALIANEGTRNWVATTFADRRRTLEALMSLAGGEVKTYYRADLQTALDNRVEVLTSVMGADLGAKMNAITALGQVDTVRSYPLLANSYYSSVKPADIIEYINLKDAAAAI